jgi:hypothetical protein
MRRTTLRRLDVPCLGQLRRVRTFELSRRCVTGHESGLAVARMRRRRTEENVRAPCRHTALALAAEAQHRSQRVQANQRLPTPTLAFCAPGESSRNGSNVADYGARSYPRLFPTATQRFVSSAALVFTGGRAAPLFVWRSHQAAIKSSSGSSAPESSSSNTVSPSSLATDSHPRCVSVLSTRRSSGAPAIHSRYSSTPTTQEYDDGIG